MCIFCSAPEPHVYPNQYPTVYTTNPTKRHRACSPSNPAERSPSAHRAVPTERSPSILPSIPPSTFWGMTNFAQGGLKHTKNEVPNCSVGCSTSTRQDARWNARRALGGNCSVGARRALGRIARRACSVALGGISGVKDVHLHLENCKLFINLYVFLW